MDKNKDRNFQIDFKPMLCKACGGKMGYVNHGKYQCETCGAVEMDDFGKVRQYIEEHGPSPAFAISEETGVPVSIINSLLRAGRVEIPEGSEIYIKCERCGRDIRYGRFCPECALNMTKQIQGGFEVGEVPKHKPNTEQMRFLDSKRKR